MSCVDLMYQFYSPYFSYKSPADDVQKFPSQPLYDASISGPSANNFLDNHGHHHHHHLPNNSNNSNTNNSNNNNNMEKEAREPDKSSQPRTTHYLASNCVLFTYFSGETASVVDEHFSRALSQPSSYTLDKPAPSNKPYSRSESLLMCHRKLPPSFWNSSYQPPYNSNNSNGSGGSSSNFSLGADAYFQSSLYNFHKTWPYHYPSHQSHTYPHPQSSAHGLPYPGMDATGRLTSHYGSFMMPGPSLPSRMPDSRHGSQYDFSKGTDAFSNYYSMGRFGADVESTLPGLDLPLQQAKKEHYW